MGFKVFFGSRRVSQTKKRFLLSMYIVSCHNCNNIITCTKVINQYLNSFSFAF